MTRQKKIIFSKEKNSLFQYLAEHIYVSHIDVNVYVSHVDVTLNVTAHTTFLGRHISPRPSVSSRAEKKQKTQNFFLLLFFLN